MKPTNIIPLALDGADPGRDDPTIFRLQPLPRLTMVSSLRLAYGQTATALVRFWRPGDVARCRLCERGTCCAANDTCLVLVNEAVPDEAADLYDAGHIEWQEGGVR